MKPIVLLIAAFILLPRAAEAHHRHHHHHHRHVAIAKCNPLCHQLFHEFQVWAILQFGIERGFGLTREAGR